MSMLKHKVVKNASWIIVSKVVQSLLGLVISMFTARYLGPSNFGLINYAASIVAFVVPIMRLGLDGILVQEIVSAKSASDENKILSTAILMNLISSVLCIIGVLAFVSIVNTSEPTTITVCFLYSLLLPAQAIEMIHYWYQAKLASKYTSIVSLIAYLIVSAYKIYLLIFQKDVSWFAISNALDSLLIGLSLWIIYRKNQSSFFSFSMQVAKSLLHKGKYYIISNMMITIFVVIANIMLKLMIDEAETGFYAAAFNCMGMTSFVFAAIIDSMRPIIFEKKQLNEIDFETNVSRLYSIIIYLSLAQSIVFTIGASLIINFLYGEAYQNSIVVLQVLIWQTTFSYIGSVRNIWILANDKQKYLWLINLLGALANIVLNLIFIPNFGALGAAIATLVTQIFTNVILGYIIRPIAGNNKLVLRGLNVTLLLQAVKQHNLDTIRNDEDITY